jgi:hypothetical protein
LRSDSEDSLIGLLRPLSYKPSRACLGTEDVPKDERERDYHPEAQQIMPQCITCQTPEGNGGKIGWPPLVRGSNSLGYQHQREGLPK